MHDDYEKLINPDQTSEPKLVTFSEGDYTSDVKLVNELVQSNPKPPVPQYNPSLGEPEPFDKDYFHFTKLCQSELLQKRKFNSKRE